MPQGPPRRRRARPVADAPIDALLLRAEDLAKGWLIALLEQSTLEEAASILAAELARDGPRICDAVVRALGSEDDLRRLESGGALERLVAQIGEIAGSTGTEATSRAVDALQAVVWSGLRDELPRPDADQITELAERLGLVIEVVRVAALRWTAELEGGRPGIRVARPEPVPESPRDEPSRESPRAEALRDTARADALRETVRTSDVQRPEAARLAHEARREVTHARTEPLWVDALDDEIERAGRAGAPLSLLLVELEDADRMASVETQQEASGTFGRFAQAMRSAMRRKDILACESESRAWLIARDTTRAGAHALASRIAKDVGDAGPWRGAPMAVSVGVAVLGEDGRDRTELLEAAEEARFVASASGIPVVSGLTPEESES
jgi:GGDEF domain-containing protein